LKEGRREKVFSSIENDRIPNDPLLTPEEAEES